MEYHVQMGFRAILCCLAAVGAGAAQGPPINIAGADNTGLTVALAVDSPSFSRFLLVQAVDNRGAKGVTVKINPLVGPGQRWVQPRAAWWIDKKEVAAEAAQDIKGLEERTLKITASFPVPGKYTGTIDLIYDASRHTYKFEIERSPDSGLLIRDKEISLELATLSLQTAIQSTGVSAVRNVKVEVHDLIGPDARQITPQVIVDGKPAQPPVTVDLPPNGQVPLTYNANLPIPGKYTGTIDLIFGLQRQSEKLTITRVDAKVPVTIRPIESAEAQNWPWISDAATVRVILEGTRAETVTLDRPLLSAFSRKESEKVNKSAVYGAISIQQVGLDGKLADVANTITLTGRTPVDLRVTIPGLSAGEYSGTFSAVAKDLSPQEATFTLYVRNHFLIAAALIALSVYLSYRLRLWAIRDRPRLQAQRQIAQLSADVDATRSEVADATPAEQKVLDSFSQRLAKLFSDWDSNAVTASDTILKEIGDKLVAFGKWVNLRRRFAHVELPPPTIRPMLAALAAFGGQLQDKTVDAKSISDAIDKLGAALSKALGDAMANAIAVIRADILQEKTTTVGKLYADKLDQEVESQLKIAEDLAKTDDTLAEAAAALEEARLLYTRTLAVGLEAQLPTASPELQNIPQDRWDKVLAAVKEDLAAVRKAASADAAAAAYAAGYSTYLNTLLDAAQLRLDAAPDKASRSTLNVDDKKTTIDDIAAAGQLRIACATLLASHDVTRAAAKYEELKRLIVKIQLALGRGGQQMKHADGTAMAVPASAIQVNNAPSLAGRSQGFAALPPRPDRIRVSVADLAKKIEHGELIVVWIAGAVAVLLGVKLLWVPSPTWGVPSDWITAILWGLGLHQVSGAVMGQFDWNTMLAKLPGGPGGGGASAQG